MKRRLLKIGLLLTVGSVAVCIYLRASRNEQGKSLSPAGRESGTMLSAHDLSRDGREKEMLTMALKKNPVHSPVLLQLAEIELN